ncbi:unnamed protein product [Trichobilharzia szidati]|nr:unnamed protein product [Trichobilharzia szidati]
MAGLELLTIDDIVTVSPHTKLLVSTISENANKVGECVKQLRDSFQAVCRCESQLAAAYRELSSLLRDMITQRYTFCSDEEMRQLGFQFSSFLDELGLLHEGYGDELRNNLVDKLQDFLSGVFDKLPKESEDMENCEKLREQAFQNFMKLPKKCSPKIHQNCVLEVTSTRRKFACMAARYYGHLNEAEQIRDLAPLISIQTFIAEQKNHIQTAYNLFNQDIVNSFIEMAEQSLQKYIGSFEDVRRKSLINYSSVEHKSLSYFCPEPWILNGSPNQEYNASTEPREPNKKLLTKSGCLLMRTRANLVWKWIEVYCLTQNGNLMYQQYGDIAASLLFDLNQKGVYAEATDADDRRNVFQVISPTERKTVLLQAESETERDEWISTIMNMIFHTNRLEDLPVVTQQQQQQYSKKTQDAQKVDIISIGDDNRGGGVGDVNIDVMDSLNPVEHDLTYIDWFSNYLPQIHFDLNPINDELTNVLTNELLCTIDKDKSEEQILQSTQTIDNNADNATIATNDDANSQSVEANTSGDHNTTNVINQANVHNTTSNELTHKLKLFNMFPCEFLGAVDLPMDHFPTNQFNDIFTYVLSCRSASDSPLPIPCKITITTSDLWVLSNQDINNVDVNNAESIKEGEKEKIKNGISWNNHPDNQKLGCLVVQGPLNDIVKFSNNNGCIGFTFESEVNQSIIECLLAAEFNRLDKLQDEKDHLERGLLTSSIAQISNNTLPEINIGSSNTNILLLSNNHLQRFGTRQ